MLLKKKDNKVMEEFIKESEYKTQFKDFFSKLMSSDGSFYRVVVRAEKFNEWFEETKLNSKNFIILKADFRSPLYECEQYNMYIYTDYKFYTKRAKLIKAKLTVLFSREVEYIPRMIFNVMNHNDWIKLKMSVGDKSRVSKSKFIFNGFGFIFFMFEKELFIYNMSTGESLPYIDSKQVNMFKESLINNKIISFFESYILKSLPV